MAVTKGEMTGRDGWICHWGKWGVEVRDGSGKVWTGKYGNGWRREEVEKVKEEFRREHGEEGEE